MFDERAAGACVGRLMGSRGVPTVVDMKAKADIIRDMYDAFRRRDRAVVDAILTDDFRFTSPYDDAIDKASWWERCWPNGDKFLEFQIKCIAEQGREAFVQYEVTTYDSKRFNNVELFTFDDERVVRVEVYFGASYQGGVFEGKPPA